MDEVVQAETQIPLTVLPEALYEPGFEAASCRMFYTGAVDQGFPARWGADGRCTVLADDLGSIAEVMGQSDARAA